MEVLVNVADLVDVASIAVICYMIGMGVKVSPVDDKYIPVIVGVCGGVLGAVGLYVIPGYPSNNLMDAVAVGIVSGLSATGAHQIGKQLSQK